jgi:hypothetical protein
MKDVEKREFNESVRKSLSTPAEDLLPPNLVQSKPFGDIAEVSGMPETHLTDFGKRVNEHRDQQSRQKQGALDRANMRRG